MADIPLAYLLHHPSDKEVADGLRRGLERFSRPRGRRRAVEVRFDLPTDLGADEQAAKLVVLASPAAASSPEVDQALARWLAARGSRTVFPVVIGSPWTWDEAAGDFASPEAGTETGVPPSLRGAYPDEPRHLNLITGASPDWYSLRNAAFRDQVAELAASVRGVGRDRLEDDDRRQQRRRTRLAAAAAVALAVLSVASGVLAIAAQRGQRAADEQRIAADLASAAAEEQTRLATAARLSSLVLTDQPADQTLRRLLAATAHDLDPSPRTAAALLRSIRHDGSAESPQLPGFRTWGTGTFLSYSPDVGALPLLRPDGVAAFPVNSSTPQAADLLLTSTLEQPTRTVTVPEVDEVLAIGGGGRWVLANRSPTAVGGLLLLDYDGARDLPPGRYSPSLNEVRPADGPQPCEAVGAQPCQETVIVDLETGETVIVRPDLGVYRFRPNPDEPWWPDPLTQHRFTDDGRFLLSHDPVVDQLVVVEIATGRSTTVWSDGDAPLADFGLLDDAAAWRLHGSTLEFFDLATMAVTERFELGGLGRPTAVDIDPTGARALVGLAPASYALVDLATMAVSATKATGDQAEEVLIGPNGEWAAIGGGGLIQLVDVETLTTMATQGTVFQSGADGLDEAEFAFDPAGRWLMVRPVNPATPSVSIIHLGADRWHREVCDQARRRLTDGEWDEYVGLSTRSAVCDLESAVDESDEEATPNEPVSSDPSMDDPQVEVASPGEQATGAEPAGELGRGATADPDDAEVASDAVSPGEDEDGRSATPPETDQLVLDAGGLAVVDFGADEATTVEAITAILGGPDGQFSCDLSTESPCGPHDPLGSFFFWPWLSVHIDFNSGTFSSYTVFADEDGNSPAASTPTGVVVGSSVDDLLAAHSSLQVLTGCQDYEPVYQPATSETVEGELIDESTGYSFGLSEGRVSSIQGATESMAGFWASLTCAP